MEDDNLGRRAAVRETREAKRARRGEEMKPLEGTVLAWPVDSLVEHDPRAAGVAPLPRPTTSFPAAAAYYEYMHAFAVEEARGKLAAAVKQGREQGGNRRFNVTTLKAVGRRGGRGKKVPFAASVAIDTIEVGRAGGMGKHRMRGGEDKSRQHDWKRPYTVLVVRGRAGRTSDRPRPRLACEPPRGAVEREADRPPRGRGARGARQRPLRGAHVDSRA